MGDDFIDDGWEFVEEESDGEGSVEYVGFSSSSDEEPPTSPAPDGTAPSGPLDRGAIAFDGADTGLIQKMEIRGNNGVTDVPQDVETKYLLVGPTRSTPTDLIQLDDPSFYSEVTETSIRYNTTMIADQVASLHENGPEPRFIASIHTHPSGQTKPSSTDRENPESLKREFERHFADFEFFQGIHGLQDPTDPDATTLRELHAGDGHVWWYGENRRHEVAFYESTFRSPAEVVVE